MSTNNDVYQVLVIPEQAAVNTAGTATVAADVHALPDGEWGAFNYDDNTTIDLALATTPSTALPKSWYIAYRGDGTIGEAGKLYLSAGSHIQTKHMRSYTEAVTQVMVSQVLTLTDMVVESGASATNYDYGIKMDFRGNTEVYQRFGMNQASKFYTANTRCVGTTGASDGAAAEVAAQLVAGISTDTDKFLDVHVSDATPTDVGGYSQAIGWYTGTATASDEATVLAAIRALDNATQAITVTITVGDFSKLYFFCNVNPKYFKQRQIKAIPALANANCAWASFTETTPMDYEIGRGYDIQELEYVAGGWNGKPGPYRQSRLHGLPFMNFEYLAVKDTFYDVFTYQYDQFSVGGWLEYLNNQSTYVAVVAATPGTPTTVAKADLDLLATLAGLL